MAASPRAAGLRAEGLSVARGGEPVLVDVNLAAQPGAPLALLGPSGSGKTSLLLTLAGVIPPRAGRVWVGDRELGALGSSGREALRRHTLALLSQELELLPRLSVEKNAALSGLVGGLPAEDALARAREELDALELGAMLQRSTDRLSRGQRQRVALARALVHPGALLLLDEPSTALDARLRDRLLERLSARAARGHTILVATHDPAVAAWASEQRRIAEGTVSAAPEGGP